MCGHNMKIITRKLTKPVNACHDTKTNDFPSRLIETFRPSDNALTGFNPRRKKPGTDRIYECSPSPEIYRFLTEGNHLFRSFARRTL